MVLLNSLAGEVLRSSNKGKNANVKDRISLLQTSGLLEIPSGIPPCVRLEDVREIFHEILGFEEFSFVDKHKTTFSRSV